MIFPKKNSKRTQDVLVPEIPHMGIKESELGLPRLGLCSVLELPRITECNLGVDSKMLAGKHSKLENKVISAKYSQQFFLLHSGH